MKNVSLLLLSSILAGCASQPTVKSWMDPVSSATITAQNEPLVLARDDENRPIEERDYAQLAAIEVNRMGDRRLYLVAVLWSTINRTGAERDKFENAFSRIEVQMGERSVVLARHAGEIAELGVGQSQLPLPIPGSKQIYFPIERADLRALASSSHVKLVTQGQPEAAQRYEEWQDGRRSLSDFLSQLPGEPAALP